MHPIFRRGRRWASWIPVFALGAALFVSAALPGSGLASAGGSAAITTEQAKLVSTDAAPGDLSGWHVAISGNTAVVGAQGKNGDKGRAYVYVDGPNGWSQQAELRPGNSRCFEQSVAVHVTAAGATAVVGAPCGYDLKGAAAVYFRPAGSDVWSRQAVLRAGDAGHGDFGASVAVSGSNVLIGAPNKSHGTGAVYVFHRSSGGVWTQTAELTAADGAAGDEFGEALSLSGSYALIGAVFRDDLTGAVYFFHQTPTGWSQQAEFAGSGSFDQFGGAVAISGPRAIVGAIGSLPQIGAAYVFTRSGSGWSQTAELTASNGAPGDLFGWSVGLSGSTAVIGARDANGGTGAAYSFEYSGTTGLWTQTQELVASDGAPNDLFGYSVATNGSTAVVGAPYHDFLTGAAYVYATG
jgi:hypothetical protein